MGARDSYVELTSRVGCDGSRVVNQSHEVTVDVSAPRKRVERFGRKRDEEGFTLIEMLVVITIIGLIMALVGPRVLNYLSDSKIKAARIQIESFKSALDLYNLDNGAYPTTAEGLTALVNAPSETPTWHGPYLQGGIVPADPWGHPYDYQSPSEHGPYEIVSDGPNGKGGGLNDAKDITSWTR
jgi:general secretion pathway protein G